MLNHDLLRRAPSFNRFTAALRNKCLSEGGVMVRMRNGLWQRVIFTPEKPGESSLGFRAESWDFVWEPDGKSLTSTDFDLIELKG